MHGAATVRKPFKRSPVLPHRSHMSKAETLLRIKEAEAQNRTTKEAAERERELTLREARRAAPDLVETFREQPEPRYRDISAAADAGVAAERDKMLAVARADAARSSARVKARVT